MLHASLSWSLARRFVVACVALVSTAALFAQTPSAADGFDPNVNGNVYTLAVQPDGKTIIGGEFSLLQPNGQLTVIGRNNLARLNADGSIDASFDANTDGPVRTVVLQPDGKILIGGEFGSVQPTVGVSHVRSRIARLNADGSVDATFNPNISGSLQPAVYAIVLQADGRIVVGGQFTTVQPAAAPVLRRNLARFNADGSVDTAFDPRPNGMVLSLASSAGKIIVGGGFTNFQALGQTAATTRNRIARLNADGSVDAAFDPNADNAVSAITVQRDGKVLIAGSFLKLQPNGAAAATNRSRLARLNVDGSIDGEFQGTAGGNVSSIALQADGGILIGGTFSSVTGRGAETLGRGFLARFTSDGTVDTTFLPGLNAEAAAIAVQPDGKITIGGYFNRVFPVGAATAFVRSRVARLNPNGSLDTNFELTAGGRPLVSVTQSDGKMIIGGSFTSVGGQSHPYLARLNADGTVDTSYNPEPNGRVFAIAYEAATNRIVIGGAFTSVNGTTRNRLARLDAAGNLDPDFNPNVDGNVGALVLLSDGKILVGGTFNSVQPPGSTEAIARNNIMRLNANGTVDTAFNANANGTVAAITPLADGKLLIGGNFNILFPNDAQQFFRNRMARLNADGTVDTTFDPNFEGFVSGIALQSDGKIIVVGQFRALRPTGGPLEQTNRNRIVRLNADGSVDTTFDPNANGTIVTVAVQTDQKILIGGAFTELSPNGATTATARRYVARLNTDGTVDPSFNLDLNETSGGRVDSLRVLSDGRILIGGTFLSLQPDPAGARIARRNFALINANGSVDTAFDLSAAGSAGAVVNAIAVQADGKVVVAGNFSDLGATSTTNIARFNPEGTPDTSFNAALTADGPINAVAVRTNGAPVPTQLGGFAWLNANGTLRAAFAPGSNVRLSGRINATAVQADGKLIAGGAFSNLTGATNGNLSRFTAGGALDTAFNPSVNGEVFGIALQNDGRIVIVGSFTSVNGTARNRIARLNADGALDPTYDPNVNGSINAVVLQADGKAIIGGSFTGLTPNATTVVQSAFNVARINVDGTIDNTFLPNTNATVRALALQADGKVIAGGDFVGVQPGTTTTLVNRRFVARFNADGSLDTTFDPNANASVAAIAIQPNGSIVLGGFFTTLQPNAGTNVTFTRNRIARVASDGTVDLVFNPNANGSVTTVALQSDGSVVLGGDFTTLQPNDSTAPVARPRLARVNANGTLDPTFNPDVTGGVSSVAVRPDGTLLVGGSFTGVQPNGLLLVGGAFTSLGGLPVSNLALLSDDGSVGSFQPAPNGAVNALLPLSDGRFLVGGGFTMIAGVTRTGLARFNADGTLDTGFNATIDGTVLTVAVQADGKILIGGNFTTVNGTARAVLARLEMNGSLDASFAPGNLAGATITSASLAVQPDGRVLFASASVPTPPSIGFGGFNIRRFNANGTDDNTFTSQGAIEVGRFATIALQTNGKIIVGGSFPALLGTNIARLARLNANGTVDTSFDPQPNGDVTAVALQADGRLLIGGTFTRVGSLVRIGLARLAATGFAESTIAVTANRDRVLWTTAGTLGQMSGVLFELSTDGRTWTSLGAATRVGSSDGFWTSGTVALPASGDFWLRGTGIVPSGTSASVSQQVRQFNFAATILSPFTPPEVAAPEWSYFDPFTGIHYGMYWPSAGDASVISKITGNAREVASNVVHPNGNVYDQILLEGTHATVTADPGQVTRLSFLALNNDIVQVEFSGAGSLSIALAGASGPVTAEKYNQPDVAYMRGHASLTIAGADASTYVAVFSVGPLTAVNQALFRSGENYAGVAELGYVSIGSTDGKFGGVRTGNVSYFANEGMTGLYAANVTFDTPVYLGDVSGFNEAVAMLIAGFAPDVRIAGGDLFQANAEPVIVQGIGTLTFVDGTTSQGTVLPAQTNQAQIQQHVPAGQ